MSLLGPRQLPTPSGVCQHPEPGLGLCPGPGRALLQLPWLLRSFLPQPGREALGAGLARLTDRLVTSKGPGASRIIQLLPRPCSQLPVAQPKAGRDGGCPGWRPQPWQPHWTLALRASALSPGTPSLPTSDGSGSQLDARPAFTVGPQLLLRACFERPSPCGGHTARKWGPARGPTTRGLHDLFLQEVGICYAAALSRGHPG